MKKIKQLSICLLLISSALKSKSQVFNNDGAAINISNGTFVQVNGGFRNEAGSNLINNGTVTVSGNLSNNQAMPLPYNGLLRLNGSSSQIVSGSAPYLAQNVDINNNAGVVLNNRLGVNGSLSFTNGLVTATSTAAPLWFTSSGVYSGATDASHVNGYVVKEGTGNFSFPVGDNARLQVVATNLSANNSGMRVRYYPGDAGTGSFTSGGTDPQPLASYNTQEYWDISPLSSATGTVTVYWDGYNDSYSNPPTQRRVAHKSGSNWLNEGTAGTGTTAAGSVTSNSLSSWSPFTIGTVLAILPLKWIELNGKLNQSNNATITWKVEERNVILYEIEKSMDGIHFTNIGNTKSKGDGGNSYAFTDPSAYQQTTYYKIKQTDIDGSYTYSSILKISGTQQNNSIDIYPMPFTDAFTVRSYKTQKAVIADAAGNLLQVIQLREGNNTVNTSRLSTGIYFLRIIDGQTYKLLKK